MNTREVEYFLDSDKFTRKLFTKVLPFDHLPITYINPPAAFIVNTGHSTTDGEHWVVIFLGRNKRVVEYFDPYAMKPLNKEIYLFAKANRRRLIHNKKKIQHPLSINCGKFCIFYLYLKARGFTMRKIVNFFMRKLNYNDKIISNIFKKINKLFS